MDLCAYMYNDDHSDMIGTWDFTTCSDRQYLSICQHPASTSHPPFSQSMLYEIVFCWLTPDWQFPRWTRTPELKNEFTVHNHTFKVVQQGNLTWKEALQVCQSYHMDLASVPDAYVQAMLTVEVSRRNQSLWIGLFSEDVSEDLFKSWWSVKKFF